MIGQGPIGHVALLVFVVHVQVPGCVPPPPPPPPPAPPAPPAPCEWDEEHAKSPAALKRRKRTFALCMPHYMPFRRSHDGHAGLGRTGPLGSSGPGSSCPGGPIRA